MEATLHPIAALELANTEFEKRLRLVEPSQLAKQTPCPDWNVRELINHMLLGTRMSVQVLAGMDRQQVIDQLDDDLLADNADPVARFAELADEMVAGFSGPGGLEGVVAHPAGDFPRSMFVGFRVADAAVHAWDLATAVDGDTRLDAGLIQFLWDDAQPQRDMLLASGMFGDGPSGTVDEGQPLQQRYLDLLGRRP
jgi:uncharacterized protein (TIGR03086 family)